MSETTALVTTNGRTALQVDSAQADAYAQSMMKHAMAGDGSLFPKGMTQVQAVQIARIAMAYGLDPFAEELILYQGKPYVTFRGRIRKANEHEQYDGMEPIRWATADEREAFGVETEEYFAIATVWRKDRRFPFIGYGRAGGKRDAKQFVAQQRPDDMAIERAKRRALTEAFSLPLPTAEDEGWQPNVRRTERPAGEIVEGEARAIGMIRPDQIKAIHTIYKAVGWSEDEYRDQLARTFGVDSSTMLTEAQAATFIEMLGVVEAAIVAASDEAKNQEAAQAEPLTVAQVAANLRAARGEKPKPQPVQRPRLTDNSEDWPKAEDGTPWEGYDPDLHPGESMKRDLQQAGAEGKRAELLGRHAMLLRQAETLGIAKGYAIEADLGDTELEGLTSRLADAVKQAQPAGQLL